MTCYTFYIKFMLKKSHRDFLKRKSHQLTGGFVEVRGIEPLTFCLPGKRSSQLS
jgi:hypothetical protein